MKAREFSRKQLLECISVLRSELNRRRCARKRFMASKIKDFREKNGVSQVELADKLGCSEAYVHLMESGRRDKAAGKALKALESGKIIFRK